MKIKVTKLDAAIRQLKEAINLFFEERDPIAIHTLVRTSLEILHDIMISRGIPVMLHKESDMINESYRKEWAIRINEAKNFFKHADKDIQNEITEIEFDSSINEMFLVDAIHSLRLIKVEKYEQIPEFGVFTIWSALKYPDLIISEKFVEVVKSLEMNPENLHEFKELINGYYELSPEERENLQNIALVELTP